MAGRLVNVIVWGVLLAIVFKLMLGNEFETQWIYPYLLLFSPFRETTLAAWQTYSKINTKVLRPASPIPEILYSGMTGKISF